MYPTLTKSARCRGMMPNEKRNRPAGGGPFAASSGRILSLLPRGNDVLRDVIWHYVVVIEFHSHAAAAFGHRAECRGVAEHLRERDFRAHDLVQTALIHSFYLAALAGEIARDVTHELLRHNDLNAHDGLENDGFRFARRFLERHRCGDLKGDFRRVDIVILAVVEVHRDVDHREAGEEAAGHRLAHALLHRRNVFLRDDAALDVVDEFKMVFARKILCYFLSLFERLHLLHTNLHMAILTATAGLFDIFTFRFSGTKDCFAIRHLRLPYIRQHVEFALHAVHEDFQMQLAHAGNDTLACLVVGCDTERRVLVREFA